MNAREMLHQAASKFEKETQLQIEFLKAEKRLPGGRMVDFVIEIKVGKEKTKFFVEAKGEMRRQHLVHLLEQLDSRKTESWLILSQYIPKPLKAEMRANGINYLEVSGNCFIRQDSVYVYVNDQPVTPVRMPEAGKLWKSSGLKFLFAILEQPEIINEPYRKLAGITDIALGSVSSYVEELKKGEFLKIKSDGRFHLDKLDQLRKKWTELYPTSLKEKLKLGRFRFADKSSFNQWKEIPTKNFYWGGEAAGSLLTKYLQPETLTIYTKEPKIKLMTELKLIPDEQGNVELVEIFWNTERIQAGNGEKTVPPLLAYADLKASFDSRNRETAEKIQNMYFK